MNKIKIIIYEYLIKIGIGFADKIEENNYITLTINKDEQVFNDIWREAQKEVIADLRKNFEYWFGDYKNIPSPELEGFVQLWEQELKREVSKKEE